MVLFSGPPHGLGRIWKNKAHCPGKVNSIRPADQPTCPQYTAEMPLALANGRRTHSQNSHGVLKVVRCLQLSLTKPMKTMSCLLSYPESFGMHGSEWWLRMVLLFNPWKSMQRRGFPNPSMIQHLLHILFHLLEKWFWNCVVMLLDRCFIF